MPISDKKTFIGSYYESDVLTMNDYYPFGSQMQGRKYLQGNTKYRYGFNGKENDNEVKGEGNQQDYGMRIYDPRLGRFLSVDPLTKSYPWYTPYFFAGNKPIWAIDLDGLEEYIKTYTYENGKATFLRQVTNSEVQIKYTSNSEKNGQTPFIRVIIDKRTGKPMNPSEIGHVQHQYVNSKGNKLKIGEAHARGVA